MPYAVIAPGINTVYDVWNDVSRIVQLYPFAKWRKFKTQEECWEFVRRNTTKRLYTDIYKYGDTFNNLYVRMEYFIRDDCVCYNFHTKKIGYIYLESEDENVDIVNRNGIIKARLNKIYLNDELITNHLIAIWHGLKIVGELIDVDVVVPDHSIFYALMTYKGNNRTINRVRTYINERVAKVSISMRNFGGST